MVWSSMVVRKSRGITVIMEGGGGEEWNRGGGGVIKPTTIPFSQLSEWTCFTLGKVAPLIASNSEVFPILQMFAIIIRSDQAFGAFRCRSTSTIAHE